MSETETGSALERPELFFTVAMLHNVTTDRYHPIWYKPKPQPSWRPGDMVRSQSMGHHTDGFDTHEEALKSAKEMVVAIQDAIDDPSPKGIPLSNWASKVFPCLEKSFPWDGESMPAYNNFFGYDKDGNVTLLM